MAGLDRRNFDSPEEVCPFEDDKGRLDLVHTEAGVVGRGTFQPGWQWSKHVKPIVRTDSCTASHVGYVISGRLRVRMDDGAEEEFGPADLITVPPGHDAWVVGDQPCVIVDWTGYGGYARPR
ncbi:cupin domain-containing protein [Goodfellowiella coeruleoviolacea]|uniref:Cupin domain n=1 Tax=Goodfellowiella coeruleoviolacea TaxID=334858 RepID=A0AAE3GFA1_9PSEU|nr:cupin domain-containing protein [Goodfellowiella coeruleoviolacea]MCP2165088.1 Cupin domain [Goodfellowiella coeruleoviolacea]